MRLALLLTALLVPTVSFAAPSDWRFGPELGLLLHEEASGNRMPVPYAGLRLDRALTHQFRAELDYGFGLTSGGAVVVATRQQHWLALRPSFTLPLRSSSLVLAAGPMAMLTHTAFIDEGRKAATATVLSAGASVGTALLVHVGALSLRAGFDVLWLYPRVDFLLGAGVMFDLGGR